MYENWMRGRSTAARQRLREIQKVSDDERRVNAAAMRDEIPLP
jgi:hypothetical protein